MTRSSLGVFSTATLIVVFAVAAPGCGDAATDPVSEETSRQLETTEVHQWCAAAGTSWDGQLEALKCAGPHEIAGFEATDGETVWQPGALHVIAD